jgi:hypothetical protein
MATISVTVPDAVLPELVDALCQRYGYQANILVDGVSTPNPETRNAFARRQLSVWLEGELKRYRRWVKEQLADPTPAGITS